MCPMRCCKDFAEILKETITPLNVIESKVIQLRKHFGEIIPEFKGMADSMEARPWIPVILCKLRIDF